MSKHIVHCSNDHCDAVMCLRDGPGEEDAGGCLSFEKLKQLKRQPGFAFKCLRCTHKDKQPFPDLGLSTHNPRFNWLLSIRTPLVLTGLKFDDIAAVGTVETLTSEMVSQYCFNDADDVSS